MTTTPQTLPELLPCPFCGSTDTYAMDMGGWESFCKTCGTNGPALNTERDKVIADWNQRAAQPLAVAAIPEGMALVPIEPTDEMCVAGLAAFGLLGGNLKNHRYDFGSLKLIECFKAMSAAAPQAPQPPAGQQDRGEATGDAETYLRKRYGAYRGHFAWRELEEAFNAGAASPPRGMTPLTEERLREIWHEPGPALTFHDLHCRFARAVEKAHGIGPPPSPGHGEGGV